MIQWIRIWKQQMPVVLATRVDKVRGRHSLYLKR